MVYDPYAGYEPSQRPLTQEQMEAREFLWNAFAVVLTVGTVAVVGSVAAKLLR